jgi:hypothetical protein
MNDKNNNPGNYKVSQTKHGTQWDRVDIHKEWFGGGDLNGFRDIWALSVSGGWNHQVMS